MPAHLLTFPAEPTVDAMHLRLLHRTQPKSRFAIRKLLPLLYYLYDRLISMDEGSSSSQRPVRCGGHPRRRASPILVPRFDNATAHENRRHRRRMLMNTNRGPGWFRYLSLPFLHHQPVHLLYSIDEQTVPPQLHTDSSTEASNIGSFDTSERPPSIGSTVEESTDGLFLASN